MAYSYESTYQKVQKNAEICFDYSWIFMNFRDFSYTTFLYSEAHGVSYSYVPCRIAYVALDSGRINGIRQISTKKNNFSELSLSILRFSNGIRHFNGWSSTPKYKNYTNCIIFILYVRMYRRMYQRMYQYRNVLDLLNLKVLVK